MEDFISNFVECMTVSVRGQGLDPQLGNIVRVVIGHEMISTAIFPVPLNGGRDVFSYIVLAEKCALSH